VSGPDSAAIAALRAQTVIPIYVGFLDILGDPIRVTTAPYALAFTGTGDADLDGHTFSAIDPSLISVSQITMKEGGAETVTVTLSGLIGVDGTLLNQIGNKANWQGRVARLWRMQWNEDLSQAGGVWPFFTAYMTVPKIVGDQSSQTIQLDIESYLSFITAASNRSYLTQRDFDPDDLSADASIACANGTTAAGAPAPIYTGPNYRYQQYGANGVPQR
jgi:hypothetical protein